MDILCLLDIKFILVFMVLLILTNLYLTWPYNYFKRLGVPGPYPVPFFGVLREIASKGLVQIDEELIAKYGKVFGFYEGWETALMAADPEVIKEVAVKMSAKFVDRRDLLLRGPVKYSLVDVKGETWRRLRSLSTPFFTSRKLRMNSERIRSVLKHVLEYLEDKNIENAQIEGKEFCGSFTMDVICNVVFGIETNTLKEKDHPLTANAKKSMLDFRPQNPLFLLPIFAPGVARILDNFGVSMFRKEPLDYIANLCKRLLQEQRQGNQDAEIFVTALVKAHEEELDYESKQTLGETGKGSYKGMSEAEILAQAMIFIFGGFDTTATTLSFLLHALTLNPDIQQTLFEEVHSKLAGQPVTYDNVQSLEYLSWCVDETLRLYPPATRADRKCTEDGVTVNGVPLKKGHLVVFPIWYLHHQPDVWPDPHKFDPLRISPEVKEGRNPYHFMPFGVGPRNCIGMRLAVLEIKMFVVTVLQSFKLVPNAKTVPVELDRQALFTTAKDGLWFSVQRRE